MSASSHAGLSGFFNFFHNKIHNYEIIILLISGFFLMVSFLFKFVRFQLNSQKSGCEYFCLGINFYKFRFDWVLTIAIALYVTNLVFYFLFGHGNGEHN